MVKDELKNIIDEAVSRKGSDIHFIKNDDDVIIRTRRGNTMEKLKTIKISDYENLLAYVRFHSNLDLTNPKQPQSGGMSIEDGKFRADCRVSILPMMGFNSLAIRVINHDFGVTLDELPYFKENAQKLKELAQKSSGLVMLGGSKNSGKITTAYAMVDHLKKELGRNVIIIDEPSEYRQPDVKKFRVNEERVTDSVKNSSAEKSNEVSTRETGMKYDVGIKEILRHDPDVILIGEIKDENTASQAMRAAMTGHLVISTIYSKDNIGTIYRILDLGINLDELSQIAVGLVNQRLVPIETKRTALMEIATGADLEALIKQVKNGQITHVPYKPINKEFLDWENDLKKEAKQISQSVDGWVEVTSTNDVLNDKAVINSKKVKARNLNQGLELD